MLKLIVEGEPTSLKRHRTAVRRDKIIQFDSQKNEKAIFRSTLYTNQNTFKEHVDKCKRTKIWNIYIAFYFYRPTKYAEYTEAQLLQEYHTQKPDIDNCIKFVLDACNGMLWDDDAHVSSVSGQKCWSHTPKTVIYIF